jgi:hypothetical protein
MLDLEKPDALNLVVMKPELLRYRRLRKSAIWDRGVGRAMRMD